MGNIRTIEDGFQYQMHKALKPFVKEWKESGSNMEFDAWIWTYQATEFGQAVLNRIDEYCGMDEAINNPH